MSGSLSALLSTILEALRGPQQPGEPEGSRDAAVMMAMMGILYGNWEPLEKVRVPVKQYFTERLASTSRDALTLAIVDGVVNPFAEDMETNLFIGENATDGSNPLAAARGVMLKHIRWVMDGFMDYEGTPQLPFSQALCGTCVSFAGEWFATLSPMFTSPERADDLARILMEFGKRQLHERGTPSCDKVDAAMTALYQLYVNLKGRYQMEQRA